MKKKMKKKRFFQKKRFFMKKTFYKMFFRLFSDTTNFHISAAIFGQNFVRTPFVRI